MIIPANRAAIIGSSRRDVRVKSWFSVSKGVFVLFDGKLHRVWGPEYCFPVYVKLS